MTTPRVPRTIVPRFRSEGRFLRPGPPMREAERQWVHGALQPMEQPERTRPSWMAWIAVAALVVAKVFS